MIWFDDVPSFPPQAVVGVISGVLNSRNSPAFTTTSKSTVCTYICPYMTVFFKCVLYYCSLSNQYVCVHICVNVLLQC